MQRKLLFLVMILVCLFPLTSAWSGKSPKDETVFIEKYGKKVYHREWCPSLKLYKKRTTVGKATAQGYVPCSHCKPPVVLSNMPVSGSTERTAKSIKLGSQGKPSSFGIVRSQSVGFTNLPSTNCPERYYDKKIEPSDFSELSAFINKVGKRKVVSVLLKEKYQLTIRKNNNYIKNFGRPNTVFVDECTVMYDLISINLTLSGLKLKVDEYNRQLLIAAQQEVERQRQIEIKKTIEKNIEEENELAGQAAIRIAAEQEKRRKIRKTYEISPSLHYGKSSGISNSDVSKGCRELCGMGGRSGADLRACYRECD